MHLRIAGAPRAAPSFVATTSAGAAVNGIQGASVHQAQQAVAIDQAKFAGAELSDVLRE